MELALNNREIASGIWLTAFFIFAIWQNTAILRSIADALRVILKPKMLMLFVCIILYTLGMVAALVYIGFWDLSLLPDTIVWFWLVGVVMCFRVMIHKGGYAPVLTVASDNFKVSLFLTFFLNFYTFSLVVELVLVPFIFLLAFSTTAWSTLGRPDDQRTLGCLQRLLNAVFVCMLAFSVWSAISDHARFLSAQTIEKVLVAPLLSVGLVPALFAFRLLAQYENVFILLQLGGVPEQVARYARRTIIRWAHIRSSRLMRMERRRYVVTHLRQKEDVDRLIKDVSESGEDPLA